MLTVCMSGRQYLHYGMVLVPEYVVALAWAYQRLEGAIGDNISRDGIALLAVFAVAFFAAPTWAASTEATGRRIAAGGTVPKVTSAIVDQIVSNTEEGDTIVVCGNEDRIYLLSNRRSATRFSYHTPPVNVDIALYYEFLAELEEGDPAAIVLRSPFTNEPRMISYIEHRGYELVYQTPNSDTKVWANPQR
jgi:hypothetical protein